MKRFIIIISIAFISGISYSEKAQKHNPLHAGTDAVFTDLFNAALALKDSGRDDEAHAKMKEAYDRAVSIRADIPAAISLYYIGFRYIITNEIGEVESVIGKMKEISDKDSKIEETDYWLYALQYEYLVVRGDYSGALALCEKVLAGREKIYGVSNRFTIESYLALGAAYFYNWDTGKFIYYTEIAIKYSESLFRGNHLLTGIGYNNLGVAYDSKGDYDRAIQYYEKTLAIYIDVLGPKHYETATIYNNLGTSYFSKGDYDRAIMFSGKSLELRIGLFGEGHPSAAMCYDIIGASYAGRGDYDLAIEFYEKALRTRIKSLGSKNPYTAISHNDLGSVYWKKGDYERAIIQFEKALAIEVEVLGEKHGQTASTYNSLGLVYHSKGDYDRAIAYYGKALAIRLELAGEKNPAIASIYNNLAIAYDSKGDYDRSITYFEKALAIRLELLGEKHPDTANSYSNLGGAYDSKGDYDRAIENYEKSLAILLEVLGEKHPDTANNFNSMGVAYHNKGDDDRALLYYGKALAIRLEVLGEKHPDTANIYNNMGSSYESKGNYSRAIEYYRKALAINVLTTADQTSIVFSRNLGMAYLETKQYNQAYTSFLTGIETIEKVRRLNLSGGTDFTSRNINSYYYAANACFLDKNMESMFNISERMRAMGYLERLSLNAAIDAAGIDPAQGKKLLKLKDDIERLSALRQKLISADSFSMKEQQKKERDRQLDETGKQLAAAENEFNKLDAGFMKNEKYRLLRDSSVVSLKNAQEICGKEKAIVEYIIPDKPDKFMKPYAIIITGSSINAVELDSSYNFSEQIGKYRNAIKDNNKSESDKLGAGLYGKLIAPLDSFINSANINKLIIVPDGSLAFLPFDSLKTKENKYLSERYELNLTPSVTVSSMIKKRKYDKRDNLMAFGGGIYSSKGDSSTRGQSSFRGIVVETEEKEKLAAKAYNSPLEYYSAQQLRWSDLPGTEREVVAINEKIYQKKNTEVYTGQKVSEENLKSLSKSGRLKKYSSIHLACHGYYDPEYPAYSAVVFSEVSGKLKDSKDDGYMSVDETALLNLQSEIVVLSACETGLGRMVSGDGVIGLTRAFQVAGSNRVLVTLWPVSDEATEAFMISFYAKVKAGMSYSEALVKVKEEFRKSKDYSAPYFWAGFVLYE